MRFFRVLGLVGLLSVSLVSAFGQGANPAEIPTRQNDWADSRLAEKLALEKDHKFDLIMLGDSITNNFEKPEYQPSWKQYIEPWNAINIGISAARTENVLYNIQRGALDGQSPKVVTLLIGTNNADETHFPTHHTPEQIAGGIRAIVKEIRARVPKAKIILIRPFPYGEWPDKNSRGIVLNKTAEIVRKLADNRHVYWLDVNFLFVNRDGSMNKALLPDVLHPSPEGSRLWAEAMQPILRRLMR